MGTTKKRFTLAMRLLQKSLLEYAKTRPQRYSPQGYLVISIFKKYRILKKEKTSPFYIYTWVKLARPAQFHNWFMRRMLRRKLGRNEVVHHKNGIRSDNRFSNLEVLTRGEHTRLHNQRKVL